jgi:hypothetical protein
MGHYLAPVGSEVIGNTTFSQYIPQGKMMMMNQQNPQNKENFDYLNMPNILREPQNSTRHHGGK